MMGEKRRSAWPHYCGYALWVIFGAYAFFWRFPWYFITPNFFAEDGVIFYKAVVDKGYFGSLFVPFNGYFILGNNLLVDFAVMLTRLFHVPFVLIPRVFALVSYLFLSFVVTLPWLLFRRRFSIAILSALVLFGIFVPMGDWDYAIIGIIGNTKFFFIYLSFLLTVYRLGLSKEDNRHSVVDFGLAICANTSLAVYPTLAFIGLGLSKKLYQHRRSLPSYWSQNRSIQSYLMLWVLVLPQVMMILYYGLPKLPGYLDSHYIYNHTIEIFVNRLFLYPEFFRKYGLFENWSSILVLLTMIGIVIRFRDRRDDELYALSVYAILFPTVLILSGRPGISAIFHDYRDPGPSQFFVSQNLIVYFILALVMASVAKRARSQALKAFVFILLVVFILFPIRSGIEHQANRDVGSLANNTETACDSKRDTSPTEVAIPLYPDPAIKLIMLRSEVCQNIDHKTR